MTKITSESSMTAVAISIGSNLGNPIENVQRAIQLLNTVGEVVCQSSLYHTKPWGILDQPDFINAAVIIKTSLSPFELLGQLKTIENELGRMPTIRWGPRLIDLDILTFGDLQIDTETLKIPHPGMLERAFVLAPLAEIDPAYIHAWNNLPANNRAEVTKLIYDEARMPDYAS